MANMSYCRFHNTALNLQDCIDAIESSEYGYDKDISEMELRGLSDLFELSNYLVNDLQYDVEKILSKDD